MERPEYLDRGELARLFPVLSDTSKEGRTTSIFLSCMMCVREFGVGLLSSLRQSTGKTTRIVAFTEVSFKAMPGDKQQRPDGLLIVKTASREWRALIEAKVGNAQLSAEQVQGYIHLAKANKIDAVITISNEFAASPEHHPLGPQIKSRGKVELFHWSWMYILTQANLLIGNDALSDSDQQYILREFVRFVSHGSAGVRGFDRMPPCWSELVQTVAAGGAIPVRADTTAQTVGAWHQELRDLSLILSRQLGIQCSVKLSKQHAADPVKRLKDGCAELSAERVLRAKLDIPDAASELDVVADLSMRTIFTSMRLRAPDDRQSAKARVNWLLRQLKKAERAEDVSVRLVRRGSGADPQVPLQALLADVDRAMHEHKDIAITSFDIVLANRLGARFGQVGNFIKDLESTVPGFYHEVGQHLRAYQPPAPRMREDKSNPESVSRDAIQRESEASDT